MREEVGALPRRARREDLTVLTAPLMEKSFTEASILLALLRLRISAFTLPLLPPSLT
jgi:hypothetical protein